LPWIEALRTLGSCIMQRGWPVRWTVPAFPKAFPWFGHQRFWADHILGLREQLSAMNEPHLKLL
jgi:hypothetical protein